MRAYLPRGLGAESRLLLAAVGVVNALVELLVFQPLVLDTRGKPGLDGFRAGLRKRLPEGVKPGEHRLAGLFLALRE